MKVINVYEGIFFGAPAANRAAEDRNKCLASGEPPYAVVALVAANSVIGWVLMHEDQVPATTR